MVHLKIKSAAKVQIIFDMRKKRWDFFDHPHKKNDAAPAASRVRRAPQGENHRRYPPINFQNVVLTFLQKM